MTWPGLTRPVLIWTSRRRLAIMAFRGFVMAVSA